MKVLLYGKGDKRGIYKITNLKNGRIYFGSTGRLRKRAYEHKKSLEDNKHQNVFLQNDFNKCDTKHFLYEVVEVVEGGKEELLKQEQRFLDQFFDKGKKCYNLCPTAGSREGAKNSRPYNPETDGRAKPKSEEWLKTVSVKNKKTWNKPSRKEEASGHAMKRWANHSADITVTNKKTGESVLIKGSVRAFCEAQGISYKAFHLMVKGKTKSSGGFFLGTQAPTYVSQKGEKRSPLSAEHRAKISGGRYEGVQLRNTKTGEVAKVRSNAKEFCRQRSISYSSFQKMMKGKCKSASGWKI